MISFTDYMTNLNAGNSNAYTGNQQAYHQQEYTADANRETNNASIQGWEQSRNPYYAAMYDQQTGASNQQAQQGYNDSLKKLQLQHLGRGTGGGSQELYNQSQLGAHYQQQAARGAQNAQNYVQGVRQNDKGRASQMRMDQYNQNPEMQSFYDSLRRADSISGQGHADYIQGRTAMDGINQHYQNNMSQVYGAAAQQGMAGAQGFAGMVG